MIIWGFRTTEKIIAIMQASYCEHCHNTADWQIVQITSWFTLFFIPIIPYRKEFYNVCPICGSGFEVPKEEAVRIKAIVKGAPPALESKENIKE